MVYVFFRISKIFILQIFNGRLYSLLCSGHDYFGGQMGRRNYEGRGGLIVIRL